MQFRKTMYLLLGAMVLGSVLTFVPTAAAQHSTTVTLQINAPTDSVKPLQAPLIVTGQTTIVFDNTGQVNLVGIPLQYTVTKQPSWAQVVVSPSTDTVIVAPQGTSPQSSTTTRPFTVFITASQDAPAFAPDSIEITATANPPS